MARESAEEKKHSFYFRLEFVERRRRGRQDRYMVDPLPGPVAVIAPGGGHDPLLSNLDRPS